MKEIFVINSKLAESGGYVFGAGYNGKRLYEFLDAHIKIHGFIDMDEGKVNKSFCGKKVLPINECDCNANIIIPNGKYMSEMTEICRKNNNNTLFFEIDRNDFEVVSPEDNYIFEVNSELFSIKNVIIAGTGVYSRKLFVITSVLGLNNISGFIQLENEESMGTKVFNKPIYTMEELGGDNCILLPCSVYAKKDNVEKIGCLYIDNI